MFILANNFTVLYHSMLLFQGKSSSSPTKSAKLTNHFSQDLVQASLIIWYGLDLRITGSLILDRMHFYQSVILWPMFPKRELFCKCFYQTVSYVKSKLYFFSNKTQWWLLSIRSCKSLICTWNGLFFFSFHVVCAPLK